MGELIGIFVRICFSDPNRQTIEGLVVGFTEPMLWLLQGKYTSGTFTPTSQDVVLVNTLVTTIITTSGRPQNTKQYLSGHKVTK